MREMTSGTGPEKEESFAYGVSNRSQPTAIQRREPCRDKCRRLLAWTGFGRKDLLLLCIWCPMPALRPFSLSPGWNEEKAYSASDSPKRSEFGDGGGARARASLRCHVHMDWRRRVPFVYLSTPGYGATSTHRPSRVSVVPSIAIFDQLLGAST